jgi:hypothetical protein
VPAPRRIPLLLSSFPDLSQFLSALIYLVSPVGNTIHAFSVLFTSSHLNKARISSKEV